MSERKVKYLDTKILLPTPQACFDYGLERQASPQIPVLSSLSPFSFLKGAQFESKLFKISEAKALISSVTNLFADATKTNVDEITLTALKDYDTDQRPEFQTVRRTTDGGNKVYQQTANRELDIILPIERRSLIQIAANWKDGYNFSQSHTWGKPDDILTTFVEGGASLFRRTTRQINAATRIGNRSSTEAFQDMIDRYQGSSKPTISIPFTLFTRNNFERDIFIPIMLLNFLSYPSASQDGIGTATKEFTENLIGLVDDADETIPFLTRFTNWLKQQDIGGVTQSIDGKLERMGIRFYLGQPPPKFKVEHSSNIFKIKKGVIESFTYNFKGPWVRKEYRGLAGTFAGAVGSQIDRQFGDAYTKNFSLLNQTYPLTCECVLTIRETEPWFSDNWLELIREEIDFETAIDLIANQEISRLERIAGAAASSLPGVLPNVRRTPNGNNWVPPGETFTGVSGFL